MKRWALLILLAAVTEPGCLTGPEVKEPPPPMEFKTAPPPRAVMPQDVTDENAHEIADQLKDEMDREGHSQAAGRR